MCVNMKASIFPYIIHCTALQQRKERVADLLKKLNTSTFKHATVKDAKTVVEHDPSTITHETIIKKVSYEPPQEEHLKTFGQFTKNLHVNQLSQMLKHVFALEDFVAKSSETDWALILEDDALYNDPVVAESLDKVFRDIRPSEQNIVFLGMPNATEQTTICPINETQYTLVPVTENYIISQAAAKLLIEGCNKIKYLTNIQFNYAIKKQRIKCHQSQNAIFVNGSRYGAFVSSTNPCNVLVFNQEYMQLFEILKDIENERQNVKDAMRDVAQIIAKATVINQHPDFLFLLARYKVHQEKYSEAQTLLTRSLELLEKNNGIINHESWVLRELIRLHKHLQT